MIACLGPARAGSDTERDIGQAVKARKLLHQDAELAPYNIGVFVRERTAVLWGPVPSASVSLKAQRVLGELFDPGQIRNELEISAEPELTSTAPPLLPERLPPALPQLAPRATPPPERPQPAVAARQPPATILLPRIEIPRADALPARLPLAPEQAEAAAQDLGKSIEALLRSKAAYREIQYTLQERRVYLRGGAESDAVYELARAISRLPGVQSVILQQR